jgi:multidrug efflux pump subunit AcrA (membrane-fusion protein)
VLANQLTAAEARRAVLVQQAAEGEVVAPEAGRALSVPITPGSVVLAGDTVATVASGGYFLRLSLPERHASEISEGGTVLIGQRVLSGADAAADRRQGKLVKVYPEIRDGRVLADVDVSGLGDYFVGERTLVWIPVAHRDVVGVPPAAVTTRHGVDYVRLAAPDRPIDVAVVLGEVFGEGDARLIEVLSGIGAGDRVLVP